MDFKTFQTKQLKQELTSPCYCRYCGQDIKQPSNRSTRHMTGEHTGGWYSNWEIEHHMHLKCAQQAMWK
jgi:hypothetical protein